MAFSRRQWETLGVQHLSYNSAVEVGGYFFQPRAISHNGFIAAADWFRRIHEEAENEDDKEETAEGVRRTEERKMFWKKLLKSMKIKENAHKSIKMYAHSLKSENISENS